MSLDERLAELMQRKIQGRTNAVIARNVALDDLRFLEKAVGELRRRLDHDDLETLDSGGTIPYMGIFGAMPGNIERNLVRMIHFISDMKVAEYDMAEAMKETALGELTGPIPIRGRIGDPVPAGGSAVDDNHPFKETELRPNYCGDCGKGAEWHPMRTAEAPARDPWITHGFIPEPGEPRLCSVLVEGRDRESSACHQSPDAHQTFGVGWGRCQLQREMHSVHPSPVDNAASPSGHAFESVSGDDFCSAIVKREDLRPDPRSHRFQGGHGSKCTYSSYGVECEGTRRDHELL